QPQVIVPPAPPASLASASAMLSEERWVKDEYAQMSASMQQVAEQIFVLTNGERASRSLTELLDEINLAEIAVRHSRDMLERTYLSHDSPDGDGPAQRVARLHRTLFGLTSENVAEYSSQSIPDDALAAEFNQMWMESPGHRRNILAANSTHLGVGCAEGADASISRNQMRKCTQLFANAYAFADKPIPEEASVGARLRTSLYPVSGKPLPTSIVQTDLATDRPPQGAVPAALVQNGSRAEGQLDLVGPPGLYNLSIHVPSPDGTGGYLIIPGPFVWVR
ncbi:MAG TPA: hypothetical protein DDY14_05480, partial [Chromatiaceae bacterium]|nr:hypothetical protein [Chromatiaceae bacterium]